MSAPRHHALHAKHRIIKDLTHASLDEVPPACLAAKRVGLTRVQRAGLTFQNKVSTRVRTYCHSPRHRATLYSASWIRFCDANGGGWAQPDWFFVVEKQTEESGSILRLPEGLLVLGECKLTQTPVAWSQMEELYTPLLTHIFEPHRIVQIQCVKNLSPDDTIAPKNVCWDISQVVGMINTGHTKILWCVE